MIHTATDLTHTKELKSAESYFRQFRKYHRLDDPSVSTEEAILRGDYCFSRFSLDLIPVDSVQITDRYAQILREDASCADSPELETMTFEDPGSFVRGKKWLEKQLEKVCESNNPAMTKDLLRVLLSGGKRLRPALAQAAFGLGDDPRYPILPLMVMIELMHSASLIHDDVVDKAAKRRGIATINVTSGNLAAVQAADYILGRAMELLKIYRGSGIDERLAAVSEQMCIGELEQMKLLHRDISEETYYMLIEKKTALFIEAAAACGAIAGGCDEERIRKLEQYGYHIGIAFQIKDDILDFTGKEAFGKEIGQDAKKGLKTLPAIIGFDKAQERVKEHSDKAVSALQGLKDSDPKKVLVDMARQLEKRVI